MINQDQYNSLFRIKTPTERTLPNEGGSYSAPVANSGVNNSPAPLFNSPQSSQITPNKSKYINPKTGGYFTPEEYANYVAMNLPVGKGTGDIPQYAGDTMTKPDESASSLRNRARDLTNTRNDIATGTTDPYKVGAESGVAYSPRELAAIEKAYAGVYDPALNDVFERLKTKEDEQKRLQDREEKELDRLWDREDRIFATNESIRAWRATTGTKSTAVDDIFTDANIKTGASRAGLTIDEFQQLDSDIKNYFINRPQSYNAENKEFTYIDENFQVLLSEVKSGKKTTDEAAEEIMAGKNLPEAVKVYLVNQLPESEEKKKGWIKSILGYVKDKFF